MAELKYVSEFIRQSTFGIDSKFKVLTELSPYKSDPKRNLAVLPTTENLIAMCSSWL